MKKIMHARAILHIDGDAFFASCEQAMNPSLKGKPVVTGKERGIVSSMSYEAKALGITRAMPLYEIEKKFPQVVILPSQYEAYGLYSIRMFDVVRRYTPDVEEYSIDECFADLTGLRRAFHMSYIDMVHAIKRDLERELGFTFSAGLAPTKQLAKIASKWKKPSGVTVIPSKDIYAFLKNVPVDLLWGVGHNTQAHMHKLGIFNASDFVQKDIEWVRRYFPKPIQTIWYELCGVSILPVHTEAHTLYKTIGKTKTFVPPSHDKAFISAQLSKNIEKACIKARRHGLVTNAVYVYLKTQDFAYQGVEYRFEHFFSSPCPIMEILEKKFLDLYTPRTLYRATGVVLLNLKKGETQPDLFGDTARICSFERIFATVDELAKRYGKHTLFLGSSFLAMKDPEQRTERGVLSQRMTTLLPGESFRKRLNIPYLGDVR